MRQIVLVALCILTLASTARDRLYIEDITIEAGQTIFVINLTAQNMELGEEYECALNLSEEDIATADEILNNVICKTVIKVKRDYEWEEMGTGKLTSESMGDDSGNPSTWEVQVLKAKGYDVYKAVDCYEKGYDVMFKVNSDNTVTVPQQKAWTYTGHGPVAVVGTGTKTGNVLDCKLHHIVLSLNHDLGAYSEILTLPEK